MKKLSIVIVTYKSEADIYDCLASVWKHCDIPREELEVIVVDNSPESDGMFTGIRQCYGDDIILIHNTRNGGYGQGNNVGIGQATAPVVMVMNPDVRLLEPLFGQALQAFNRDPRLGIMGMKQMMTPTRPCHFSFGTTFMMNGYARTILMSLANRLDLFLSRWMYVDGSCFFLRREMFVQAGGYDEDCFMYGEEDDLNWRMKHTCHCHVRYDRHLRFLHLTQGREPSLEYEKKRLQMALMLNEKKGYPRAKTLRTFRQANRLLLWKARRRGDTRELDMLLAFCDYLRSLA